MMTLGQKLSQLRRENHYTQEQLADILGVSRQAISKWESDAAYPETDKLIRISELFDCSLDYLLKDAMESDPKVREPRPDDAVFVPRKVFHEKKSEKTVRGVPLWHIGKRAKGVLAIGLNARGIIAIGLKAQGVVALGLFSLGFISFGWLSLGLLSFGLFALGILSAGCFAVGILTAGAICLGVLSFGAIAVGDFSIGALAIGKYAAIGDQASAMIALGDTHASGSVYQQIGDLTAQEISSVKRLLDANVPSYLAWAKEMFKLFL